MNALVNYPQQYEEAAVRLQAESFRASQLHKKIETICELSQLESADILNSIQTLSKERKAIEVKLESVLRLGKPTNSAIRNLKNAAKWAGGGKRRFEDGLLTLRILYDALFSAIPQSNLLAKSPEINQEQQRLHDLASEIVELSGNPHEDPENIPLSEFTTTSPFSTYRIGLNDGETEPRSVSRSTSLSGSWSASRSALRTITIYEGSPSPSSCQKSRSIQSRHPLFETLYDIALQGLKFVAKTLECKDVVELVDRLQIWGLGLFQGPLALDSIFLSEEQYENILFTNPKVLRTCFLKVILNIEYMLATLQGEDAAMLSFQERMAGFLEAESIEEEVRYYSVLMMDLDASTAEDQIVGCLTDIQEEVDRLYELLPTISTYRHLYHSWLENIDIGRWGPMTGASLPIETRRVGGRWPKDSISSPANAISNPYANAFANPSANPFVNPFANPFASPFGDVSVTRVKGKKSLKPAPSALGLNDQDLDQAEELLASLNKKMASIEQQAKELSKNTQLQEVAEKFTAELDLLKKLNNELEMKSKGKQRDVKVADEGGANFDRLAKIQGISQDIGKLDSVRFEQGADADQDKTTESNRLPDETSNRPYLMSGGNPDI